MSSAAKVYVIHHGQKNTKVRGWLTEKHEPATGQRYLVGEIIAKTLKYKGKEEQVILPFTIEITNSTYTMRG